MNIMAMLRAAGNVIKIGAALDHHVIVRGRGCGGPWVAVVVGRGL